MQEVRGDCPEWGWVRVPLKLPLGPAFLPAGLLLLLRPRQEATRLEVRSAGLDWGAEGGVGRAH